MKGVSAGSFVPKATMLGAGKVELASEPNVIPDDSDEQEDEQGNWDAAKNSSDRGGIYKGTHRT